MKRWRRPRPLILLALLLLAGAVVNVAVAWVLVARADMRLAREIEPGGWLTRVPENWGVPATLWRRSGTGWREDRQSGQARPLNEGWASPRMSTVEAGLPMRALRSSQRSVAQYSVTHEEGQRPRLARAVRELPATWWEQGVPVPPRLTGGLFDLTQGRAPIRPRYGAFLINTLFYTAILALPLSFFPIRRRLRARRGRCPKCGYDLAGLGGAPCPECGAL